MRPHSTTLPAPGAAAPAPSPARPAVFAAKLAVSLGLLWWVLAGVDLGELMRALLAARPSWLALAVGAYTAMLAISVWRWQLLLAAQQVQVPARTLWQSWLVALFFNNFLPSNIGGDVWRIADTATAAGSKTLATTVVLVDRALGLAALVVIAATAAAAGAWLGLPLPGLGWLWLGAGAALASAVPFLVVPRLLAVALRPVRATGHEWSIERATRVESAFQRFRARPGALAGALAGAGAVQAIIVVYYLAAARSLGLELPLLLAAVLVPVSLAAQMVPVSINGFGVREAVFVYFFTRVGLTAESAVALSLLATLLAMVLSLAGGVVFVARRRS